LLDQIGDEFDGVADVLPDLPGHLIRGKPLSTPAVAEWRRTDQSSACNWMTRTSPTTKPSHPSPA
jgi:hypothetical protein